MASGYEGIGDTFVQLCLFRLAVLIVSADIEGADSTSMLQRTAKSTVESRESKEGPCQLLGFSWLSGGNGNANCGAAKDLDSLILFVLAFGWREVRRQLRKSSFRVKCTEVRTLRERGTR